MSLHFSTNMFMIYCIVISNDIKFIIKFFRNNHWRNIWGNLCAKRNPKPHRQTTGKYCSKHIKWHLWKLSDVQQVVCSVWIHSRFSFKSSEHLNAIVQSASVCLEYRTYLLMFSLHGIPISGSNDLPGRLSPTNFNSTVVLVKILT